MLSKDKSEPCLDGGLLPGRLPCREVGLEFVVEPPGVNLYDVFLGVLNDGPSVSDNESGVPADKDDLDTLGKLPIGTERAERSRTYFESSK